MQGKKPGRVDITAIDAQKGGKARLHWFLARFDRLRPYRAEKPPMSSRHCSVRRCVAAAPPLYRRPPLRRRNNSGLYAARAWLQAARAVCVDV
ncbi:conserved hypothetical protein [Ricinus communis]|uniref:Uncharacterized protein n=1 Tax=Ricinus communis TaxID=3988 RepID=B9TMU3_RICCO|nr:conserved hypothetical protein [Ricinus communis]